MAEAVYTQTGVGEYVASRAHLGVTGRSVKAGVRRGKIGIGGAGGTVSGGNYNTLPSGETDQLIGGIPVIYGDLIDGRSCGNDAASGVGGEVDLLFTFAKSRLGFKSDKVIISGGSHGGLVALNYAHANPAKVAALVLSIPLLNPQDVHDNDRASTVGLTAVQMEAAYGGSPASFNAAMPTHNPSLYPSDFNGIPILLAYSTNDPVCLPAYATAFAAGCSSCTLLSLGAIGHSGGSDPAVSAQAAAFIKQYA